MKKKILIDLLLLAVFFSCMGIFRADIVAISACFFIPFYLMLTNRMRLFPYYIVAFIIACIWVATAGENYGYNQHFLSIAHINFFTLFSWASGLFTLYMLYSHFEGVFARRGFISRLSFFSVLYWVFLLGGETIGYHMFNIHNIKTAYCAGLPVLHCLHVPRWMQGGYLCMGPFYITVCSVFSLKTAK